MAAQTTKLEAINVLLGVIGEATTNTLAGTLPFEVSLAVQILDETVREICQDSYVFNTEVDITMTPNVSDNISVPAHYIQVRSVSEEYVIRYNSGSPILYSMREKTSTFTADITVEIVYLLDFEDLPEAAKRYASIRAARVYADRLVGSKDIRAFTALDEQQAKAKLGNYEHAVDKINMLSDNTGVSSALNRRI